MKSRFSFMLFEKQRGFGWNVLDTAFHSCKHEFEKKVQF